MNKKILIIILAALLNCKQTNTDIIVENFTSCTNKDGPILYEEFCLYEYEGVKAKALIGHRVDQNKFYNPEIVEHFSDDDDSLMLSEDATHIFSSTTLVSTIRVNKTFNFCRDSLYKAQINFYSRNLDYLQAFIDEHVCFSKELKISRTNAGIFSTAILLLNEDLAE